MPKFPTKAERSIVIAAPPSAIYSYIWDVSSSCRCIPGLSACKRLGKDTYRFEYETRPAGPVNVSVSYTARFVGNGRDRIRFFSAEPDVDDTAQIDGCFLISPLGPNHAKVTLRQQFAPDTPIPRFLPNLVHAYLETETAAVMEAYLINAKRHLETRGDQMQEKPSGYRPR